MKTLTAVFIALLLVPLLAFGQQQTPVTTLPVSYGGTLIFRSIDLDETEEAVLEPGSSVQGPGQIYGWYLCNLSNALRYFKFYNGTVANVIVGTTVPVLTLPVPIGACANIPWPEGIEFREAITAACTTGIADSDTGAPGANECILNLFWK